MAEETRVQLPTYAQVAAVQSTATDTNTKVTGMVSDLATTKADAAAAKTNALNAKNSADAATTAAGQAKTSADSAASAATAVQSVANTTAADVSAMKTAMEKSMYAKVCRVTVKLNPTGSVYELPAGAQQLSDLLTGAKVVFEPQGDDKTYQAVVTSLTDFQVTFTVYVTNAALIKASKVYVTLGKSSTCAYCVAPASVSLANGGDLTVTMTSAQVTGTVVEVGRLQFWDPTATDAGVSCMCTRITNQSGTTFHLGGYDSHGAWLDQSMTKVEIYNCPKDGSTPLTPVVRRVSGEESWIDVSQRLDCLKNMKIVNVKFAGTSQTIDNNKFVRYDPVWTKTEKTSINVPNFAANGSVASTTSRAVVIKWFCNTQADSDYHLHPLFERYETQLDGTYATTPLSHGYIARYPIQSQNIAITGEGTVAVARSQSDGSREVGNTRSVFLTLCKRLNKCTITIEASGEADVVFQPNVDERLVSMTNICEIDFLSAMAYLMFGTNVQATLPGIMTSAVSATSNGATDYIVNQGIFTGAQDTTAQNNSIVFLGVEDGTWSSTGWMHPDWINVWRRVITTNATGAIATNNTTHSFLFCQDRAKYKPCDSSSGNNNATATEEELLIDGYRLVDFQVANSDGWKFRLGYDSSAVMRDAFLPTQDVTQQNVNMGGCDYMWQGGAPGNPGNFSASTAYAVGTYVMYDSKVYLCTDAHTAGAWNPAHFTLQANATVTLRNWYLVARGGNRNNGSSLGIAYVVANGALSYSLGNYWRSRVSLQPLL